MTEPLTDLRWFIAVGAVLVLMGLIGAWVRRLPLTSSLIYLAVGVVVGPIGLALLVVNPIAHAPAIELVSEIAVILSLFTAGLKLRVPLRDRSWVAPLRLATVSMVLTVALIAVVGYFLLDLPLGAAVLLGAILAPTDPVLASDVQVTNALDRDRVRFTLTGEAGLNDGTAFPFVMLGLGLLGLHELGDAGLRWVTVDLVWAVGGGLAVGAVLGTVIARLTVFVRRRHARSIAVGELLHIGLIALSYGVALALGTYGFLAVFAAGLAVRTVERGQSGDEVEEEAPETPSVGRKERTATEDDGAAAAVAQSLLYSNEALERIAEVALVVLVGAMLSLIGVPVAVAWLAPLLFLVLRPVAVLVGLTGEGLPRAQKLVIGWFGIRGIGSVYYLSFAITHGLDPQIAGRLAALTLGLVAASVLVHGVSVTPLMEWYQRRAQADSGRVP